MTLRPCPDVQGRAAAARVAGRAGRRAGHPRVHAACRRGARSSGSRQLELTDTERQIARLILREIDERLRFLDNVGRGVPVARPGRGHALRRRGAADPAGHPDRVEPGRRALHPRRALDRAAPARQRAPDRHAGAAARPRQHGDRRRARRGHDARRRPPGGPGPGRGRARRAPGGRGHARAGDASRRARPPGSSSRASARSPCRGAGAGPPGTSRSRARRSTTCAAST